MSNYEKLIDELIEREYLKKPEIIEAFKATPRRDFLRPAEKLLDGLNTPLPIGEGQTISQPLTVAFMLNLLDAQPGNKTLDIGFGSGWQAAILIRIICPDPEKNRPVDTCGELFAYEIVPNVGKFGRENLENALPKELLTHVHIYERDYAENFAENAPYNRIIAAASFDSTPKDLLQSLAINGIMVYPTQNDDIRKVTRESEEKFSEEIYPGFVFVPITH